MSHEHVPVLWVYGAWYVVRAFKAADGGSTRRALGRAAVVSACDFVAVSTTIIGLIGVALVS